MPAKIQRNKGDIIGTNKILEQLHKGKRIYYKCQCTLCNQIRQIRADNLNQKCRSCAAKIRSHPIRDDLTGQKFGKWTVLYKTNKTNFWHCQCQCGTERDVFRGSLIDGDSKSCGCVSSWKEKQIINILQKYNISYKKQFTFKDLIGKAKRPLRYDFAIFKNNNLYCLIEYHGRQHYQFEKNWNMTQQDFLQAQERDLIKVNYCKKNNIPLYIFNKQSHIEEEILKIMNLTKGNK